MIFVNTATRFWLLMVIVNIFETQCHDPVAPSLSDRNWFIQNDLISFFSNEGFVLIDVPDTDEFRGAKRNRRFLGGSYNGANERLRTTLDTVVETDTDNTLIDNDSSNQYPVNIETLNLESSEWYNLTSNEFKWESTTSVKILNLRYSYIKHVAEDALASVRETLAVVDLTNANISADTVHTLIESISQDGSGSSSNLAALSLARLGLTTVPYDVLESVQYSLRILSLFGNDFRAVCHTDSFNKSQSNTVSWNDYWASELGDWQEPAISYFDELSNLYNKSSKSAWGDFPSMPFLAYLDLRNCNIKCVEQGTFHNLNNLKYLSLSNNGILAIANYAFGGLMNLLFLDLSQNEYVSNTSTRRGLNIGPYAFGGLLSLTKLNLSNTFVSALTAKSFRGLPPSLITLDLRKTGLRLLNSVIFENLNNLQFLDISENIGLCSVVTRESFSGLAMLQELRMSRTSLEDLMVLQDLSALKHLDVKYNNLKTIVNKLENFPLLEHLDVAHNYINSWNDEGAFAGNRWLKSVFLHDNILSLMTTAMREDFNSLSYVTLANNSFVCNCPLKEFMEHYKGVSSNSGEDALLIIAYDSHDTSHNCTDLTLSQIFRFEETDKYCIEETIVIQLSTIQHIVYIAVLILVSCSSFCTLVYWKWWYIRYVAILLKNATVLSIINVENCEDRVYAYDIFVSYSDANRNWIFEEFMPNIEGPETNWNICMHERDFQVGVSILENIITGMDQSRTIILVISSSFIRSQWCQFEMHMAQHRLLETCREELILIFLEEIPKENQSKILRYLMMVKTYIVWPKNSEDKDARQLFWRRLKKAIAPNKSKFNSSPI